MDESGCRFRNPLAVTSQNWRLDDDDLEIEWQPHTGSAKISIPPSYERCVY
jgi:hypothetical protein